MMHEQNLILYWNAQRRREAMQKRVVVAVMASAAAYAIVGKVVLHLLNAT